MTLIAGDTVQLKSGGSKMTVESVGKDAFGKDRVWCIWFNDKGELKQHVFEPAALEKV